ncbi:MAG: hypothetical protein ACRBHB_04155 [Arenicella sp.]
MRLYSYILSHDYGFSPNPFGNYLTLSTGQPLLRKSIEVDDWLIGIGDEHTIGKERLIFAAQVSDIVSMEDYGQSSQFAFKIPNDGPEKWHWRGDNIYYQDENGWQQRATEFHHPDNMHEDLSGEKVLICKTFWYFGLYPPLMPQDFSSFSNIRRDFITIEQITVIERFQSWLNTNWEPGMINRPTLISPKD